MNAPISNLVNSAAQSVLAGMADQLQQLLASLSLQQTARLIRLSGTPVPVLVERFQGEESIDALFRFEVDVIAEIAALQFDHWLGTELSLTVIDPAGEPIVRHASVVAMSELGSDGGFTRYRLTLMPWAAWLTSRQDCWVFQNKTVLDIATELLADYPQANWQYQVTVPLRQRSLCIQYQESDWAFLCRLFAEEGLSFVFDHLPDAADGTQSRCQLRVFDAKTELRDCPASPIRFGHISASLSDDRLTAFTAEVYTQPRSVVRSSWDYRRLHAPAGSEVSREVGGDLPELEDYDGSGAYRFDDTDHAVRHAAQQQAAHDAMASGFLAEGAVRALRPATTFTLLDHADYSGQRFVVRRIQTHAANNLAVNLQHAGRAHHTENGSYRQFIECQSASLPLVPQPLAKPAAHLQTALVVGAAGDAITSDRDHRVRIQFAWQQGDAPNPGGLAHPSGDNAPNTEQSFTWVRVAEWLAGPNWGSHFTPRVGDEVLVDFVESDIDRPIIVGSLYNEQAIPPFSAGHDGTANHAGHLSGFHSQNLAGKDYNRWVMDDTPGELRTQLKSSRLSSELNLGYLVSQPAFNAWRGAYRGSGFEWRTDGWGSVRGEAGLLLSSHAQVGASDTQLASHASRQQVAAAEQWVKQLDESSQTHHALGARGQAEIAKLHQRLSHHHGAVNGQAAQKPDPAGDGRALEDPVDTLAERPALMETPAALAAISEASSVVYAAGDLQATSAGDGQLTAEHTLTIQAGNRLGLFTHHGGMKLIAAEGDVHLAAHTGMLQLASEQALTMTSTEDAIHIVAQDAVKLFGGGAEIELKGGDITFKASGTFTVKGKADWMGAAEGKGEPLRLPDTRYKRFDEQFCAIDQATNQPISGLPYRIVFGDGSEVRGHTDAKGYTQQISSADPQSLRLFWEPIADTPELPDLDTEGDC